MHTTTIQTILDKQLNHALGHLIYVVREGEMVFYVGQSKRDVVARFWEHMQKPSRLGELIILNKPDSLAWTVGFYSLADCRPFVAQKSLFAMQSWEHFDMDMAEQGMIAALRPFINRDFNPRPTPLPARYRGQHLAAQPDRLSPDSLSPDSLSPEFRLWLNRMSLAGWVYERDIDGRLIWQHRDGRTLSDANIAPYRDTNRIP